MRWVRASTLLLLLRRLLPACEVHSFSICVLTRIRVRVIFVFDSMRALPFLSATSTIETIRSRIREVSLLEGAFLPSARARHVRVVVVWSPHARAFGVNYFVTRSRATKKERKKGKKILPCLLARKKKGVFCVCVLVNRERKKTRLFGASFIDATEARARATQTDRHRERERERLKRKNEERRRRRR